MLTSQPGWLPMFLLTQMLFGAGMAIIYGCYVGHALRASLTSGMVHGLAVSYAILVNWTAAAWGAAAWVIGRRN